MSGHERSRIVGKDSAELEEFVCGICQDILNKPVVTQCCRQSYCKQCIDDWLKQQKTCPNDRQPMTSNDLTQVPRLVVNLIDNMKIKCRYYGRGCEEVVTIGRLTLHEIQCEFGNCKVCGSGETGKDHDCLAYLMNENLKLKERNVNLESECLVFKEESKSLKSSNHVLKQMIESRTNQMVNLAKELGDKKIEVTNVKQVLIDTQRKLTNIKPLDKVKEMQLTNNVKGLTDELSKVKKELNNKRQEVNKVKKELVDKKQELIHVKQTLTAKIDNLKHQLESVMDEKVNEEQSEVISGIENAKNTEMSITFNMNIGPELKDSFVDICLQAINGFSRERHNIPFLVKTIMTKINNLPKKFRLNTEWQVRVDIDTFVPDIYANYNYVLKMTWDTIAIYIFA